MKAKLGSEAIMPNPALKPFAVLVGEWKTVGTHPAVPGTTFHGRTSFEWLEGGCFLMMRSEIEEPEIPSGIAVFGSDDAAKKFHMLYFDERGISRKYDVEASDNRLTWWRDNPNFSQRMVITVANDGNTMVSKGEMSREGGPWEPDLGLKYSRVKGP